MLTWLFKKGDPNKKINYLSNTQLMIPSKIKLNKKIFYLYFYLYIFFNKTHLCQIV